MGMVTCSRSPVRQCLSMTTHPPGFPSAAATAPWTPLPFSRTSGGPAVQDGTRTRMEELAYQRWSGERVVEETFFYDPAQLVPRKPPPDLSNG